MKISYKKKFDSELEKNRKEKIKNELFSRKNYEEKCKLVK